MFRVQCAKFEVKIYHNQKKEDLSEVGNQPTETCTLQPETCILQPVPCNLQPFTISSYTFSYFCALQSK